MRDATLGFWMATLCVGVLITALAATVILGVIAYYQAGVDKIYPVVAMFGAGALLMLTAAAQLDRHAASHRRDID